MYRAPCAQATSTLLSRLPSNLPPEFKRVGSHPMAIADASCVRYSLCVGSRAFVDNKFQVWFIS